MALRSTDILTQTPQGLYCPLGDFHIEKKMGLKVSSTCEVTFGDKHPAIGYLVGEVHDGIAQMFQVIEYARMMVGTKAISTLSTGYLNALEFVLAILARPGS